jgi:4-alpha-glucanotransferase
MNEAGAARVAGEDLGVVPDYVRPSLQSLGIAGFKIPQWETRDGMIIPGETYDRLSVATYATHDHETIRALWEQALEHPNSETGQQARVTLEKIALFAGLNPKSDGLNYEKDFYPAMMDALFRCNSWIAIVMITDLLAREYRFNVPGTKAHLNWTRRIQRSIARLRSSRKERQRMQLVHELLVKTGRI